MLNKPLWMPDGSVRAIVFIMLALTVCSLAFTEPVMKEAVKLAFGIVIGFYYGSKTHEGNSGKPN